MFFLHISDTHFGLERSKDMSASDIAARNTYMDRLTEEISKINIKHKIDYIFFSGDVAWSASQEDYACASIWLKQLIKKINLPSESVFICPGNHDIDRNEVDDIQVPSRQEDANRFLQTEKLHKLQRRFEQYAQFCDDLGLIKYDIGSEQSFLVGYRDMGTFQTVCLNTAWYAKDDSVKDKMWIGAGFWEIIKRELIKSNKFTIVIMHHPSTSWHEQERSTYPNTTNVYSELCDYANIILTGHTHEVRNLLEKRGNALIGTCGALYERNHYPNCFYSYNISEDWEVVQTQYFLNAGKWLANTETYHYTNAYRLSNEQSGLITNTRQSLNSEKDFEAIVSQSNLFCIAGNVIKFIPIIGSWNKGENEYYYGDFIIQSNDSLHQLPKDVLEAFEQLSINRDVNVIEENVYEEKVRLDHYHISIVGGKRPHRVILDLSKTTYRDFLITKYVIDQRLSSGETIRKKYLGEKNSLISSGLPNICGVGIYIITADNKLLISESSPFVAVNPERYIYSASGSMDWKGSETNPFNDVIRECVEEIGYKPSIERLRLYSIGMDYSAGYYQFSFYEQSSKTAKEIIDDAQMSRDYHIEIQRIIPIDFECKTIIDAIESNNRWDETAKANLLTLICKFFGKKTVEGLLSPNRFKKNYRNSVKQEWDLRADREGRLPVLSSRYPARDLNKNSDEYIKAVLNFIDEDLSQHSILELGGGIGLFTKHFAKLAKRVTCVDVCEKMIEKNKRYLGPELIHKVDYVNCFFQDYNPDQHFDILICSLVLIHNAPEIHEIVNNMKRLADTIYLFEHTDDGAQVSMYTEPKTREQYIELFPEFTVEKLSSHMLCQDNISFIKFQKRK